MPVEQRDKLTNLMMKLSVRLHNKFQW